MTISINILFNKAIKKNPLLTFEEEISLSRMVKKGDLEARKKLVESNYRLVISIAKKYYRKHCDFEDLLQESSAGLLKAVDRFDPELGYKFSTYASWWIKQSALQFLNENQTLIGILVDGDIRRLLLKKQDLQNITKEDIKKKCVSVNNDNVLVSSLDKHYKFIPLLNALGQVSGLVKL